MRDLRRELEKASDAERVSWKPKPGDVVVGTVLGYDVVETAYGPVNLLILEAEGEDGEPTGEEVAVWLSHKVLWEQVRKARPKAGDRVGIRRLQDNESKGYKRYKLSVDREAATGAGHGPNFDEPDPGKAAQARRTSPETAGDPDYSEFSPEALVSEDGLPF
jgi:hypothetical protein